MQSTALFFHTFYAVEFYESLPPRLFGTHARSNVVGYALLKMKAQLGVELPLPLRLLGRTSPCHDVLLLCRVQDECYRAGQSVPVLDLVFQALFPFGGKCVELGLATRLSLLPLRREQLVFFELVQSGIQRALLWLEDVVRNLLNASGNCITMDPT